MNMIINKLLVLSVFVLVSTEVLAADCKLANSSVANFSLNTNNAISEVDFDKLGELTAQLNKQSTALLAATDKCDCDNAYYAVEELSENVEEAYFADDINQAKENLKSVKSKLSIVKKEIAQCASKLASSST